MRRMLLAGAALAGLAFTPVFFTKQSDLRVEDILALASAACEEAGRDVMRGGLVLAAPAYAAEAPQFNKGPPPLMKGLGATTMTISTKEPKAQAYFDQGLRMLHGFNHAEAAKAFREAQRLDPSCAMCFWGEAFALGPNINAPMDPANAEPAYKAAMAAFNRVEGVTPKERALIEAMMVRYPPRMPKDRLSFDRAYAAAMHEVAEQYADDDNVQVFAVEAIMDTQPWDYWQTGGVKGKGATEEGVERLEKVLARDPNHVGAIHLYIHMVEASANPWRAEAPADRLLKLAPAAGHLVHMPAHIYYRVGRFKDSVNANIAAAKADEAFIATGTASPIYQFGYYTHNLHFVMMSALMSGDAKTALSMADKLDGALPMEAAALPIAQPVKAAPWYARAQFMDPVKLLTLAKPAGPDLPYVTAAYHYARGVAFAKVGKLSEARAEAATLEAMTKGDGLDLLSASYIPAREVLGIMREVVLAKAAAAEKKHGETIAHYEKAVAMQDALPYTEPPYWYYPLRQSLAAAYLMDGQAARAEAEFFRALLDQPNAAYSYWGLAEAKKARGDGRGYRAARQMFDAAYTGGSARSVRLVNM